MAMVLLLVSIRNAGWQKALTTIVKDEAMNVEIQYKKLYTLRKSAESL